MAKSNDGAEARKDFNAALAEDGQTIVRVRRGRTDSKGNRHPEERIPQRVLIDTVRLQSATTISDQGASNAANSGMNIIYMSPDDGEPSEQDVIERGLFRYGLSDLDFLPVNDIVVYWFATMVRTEDIEADT